MDVLKFSSARKLKFLMGGFDFEKLEPYRMKIKKSELKEIENAKTFYGKHVAPFWE